MPIITDRSIATCEITKASTINVRRFFVVQERKKKEKNSCFCATCKRKRTIQVQLSAVQLFRERKRKNSSVRS